MIRKLIIFEGQVQSVGFRVFTKLLSINYKVTGQIRNLDNGMVEMQVQGSNVEIQSMLKEILKGNQFIKVINYSAKEIPIKENEKEYKVL